MAGLTAAGAIPLVFGFADLIEGQGFVARIRTDGRALAEQEDESRWWVNGVNPGGVCAPGDTAVEALQAFRIAVHEVLLDCAVRARTFEAFRLEVQSIFDSTTESIIEEWRQASLALRAGSVAGPLDGLTRVRSDARAYTVTVERVAVDQAKPQHDGALTFAQAA
jgi:hypothetical protein